MEPVSILVRRIPECYHSWIEEARKVSKRKSSKEGQTVYQSGGDPEDWSSQETAEFLLSQFFKYMDVVVEQGTF